MARHLAAPLQNISRGPWLLCPVQIHFVCIQCSCNIIYRPNGLYTLAVPLRPAALPPPRNWGGGGCGALNTALQTTQIALHLTTPAIQFVLLLLTSFCISFFPDATSDSNPRLLGQSQRHNHQSTTTSITVSSDKSRMNSLEMGVKTDSKTLWD